MFIDSIERGLISETTLATVAGDIVSTVLQVVRVPRVQRGGIDDLMDDNGGCCESVS